ncbi:TPA: hypothetical protein TZW92_001830 [Streptococcus suis]|nr:hypothetical protein [Streptococcus suis]HEM4766613.1 hypothetical protein [Streptococcus suis]
MNFKLFSRLYSEALECETLELFISERGWQGWMEGFESDQIVEVLSKIYSLANSDLSSSRAMSRAEFSRQYYIPIRTLEDWDSSKRTAPIYVKLLLDYTLLMDILFPGNEDEF